MPRLRLLAAQSSNALLPGTHKKATMKSHCKHTSVPEAGQLPGTSCCPALAAARQPQGSR
eukprot:1161582-Pelagomonas_calceolata.AAC.7